MAAQPRSDGGATKGLSPWGGEPGPVLFEARLAPKRSLPPHGFLGVMLVAGAATFGIGLYVFSLGAWPVAPFCGLDILALYLAFRLSYTHARLYEHICLTVDELAVERVWPGGRRQHWRLEPFRTEVELTGTAESGSRLALVCRDTRVVLGSFLSPEERTRVAEGLAAALDPARRKC